MIGRRKIPSTQQDLEPKGFEDFEMRLGDLMRGERATMAKSLLDVQRELRIKAGYIAAIEACDITAFDAPSFVAGYVRSYARYLNLDPEWAFERFCTESGFAPTHGMAPQASGPRPQRRPSEPVEALANPNATFVPKTQAFWTQIEPRALGSVLVLALLAGGIGYGGWSVLQEVQRVQLAPVDQVPGVLAELDPLAAAQTPQFDATDGDSGVGDLAATESIDRIYRPATLDAPVLIARDGPIAAIDPNVTGVLAGLPGMQGAQSSSVQTASNAPNVDENAINNAIASAMGGGDPATPGAVRTMAENAPEIEILAVRPSWVRVKSAEGATLFEKVMDAGERYTLPRLAQAPTLRTGESGAIYFAVNGVAHGPAGAKGAVTKNIALSAENLSQAYAMADPQADAALTSMFAVADAGQAIAGPVAD
ncbi:4-hydroxy-3-methylbut-2-en-1-yl diphosphate synthase [Thioclava sp. SK-1]|uniref:helix-turn-helix domain-containing protein n=1 Tax=Thioclava sp. SK-1 TaxID=1889770 RepID=UPI000826D41F|nr:helix-turn-helix domain-containing protein [Thioclava sp. SK-1]OCX66075.1 4-hydroxy-3-methylbut-2-en-1-yl diphosphate synthase [Thioclava sp. SK-1]